MAANNSVNETIDERILRLLGLLDVFDLDYETYISLLREKLVEVTASRKKIPAEEFDLLKNEFKRVKGKTGRFKPKKKKPINSKNVSNLNSFSKKLTGGTTTQAVSKQVKTASVPESLLDIVKTIRKTVDSIHKSILTQSVLSQKEFDRDRKGKENLRRRGREEKLEERKDGVLETAKKILAPFQSIFDRIIRFLVFTILGRTFKLFMDWASDPKNKKKLDTIGRFLKDWWPTLLGAWFLFATPLGRFTRTIIGTIAKLSFKLAKFAIPKLLSFAKSNPLIAAGAGIGLAAGAGFMMEQGRSEDIAKQQPEKRGQGNWWNEIGKSFNPGQLGMGGVSLLSKGGSVFSGLVDRNTGTTVSGAGPDTQFLPIAGGGGAVLQKGETVLQVGARERMIKEAGVDPLAYNIGNNANKPRNISTNILGSARGGLIGLNNGGQIGINNPNFWITAAIAGKEAGHIPQGQADVAQSIYNRSKKGIHPGGKDIRKIITAAGQYQPTFSNPGLWNAIKDRASAINAVGDSKLVDMAANSLLNPILQRNAANFIGSRTDFMGESQKPYMKPKKGDITRGKQHNFFGWFTDNAYNMKMGNAASSPFAASAPSQKTKQPSMMDRIGGAFSGVMNKIMGRKGGGIVKGTDGTYNPHSSSDTRMFPIVNSPNFRGIAALQPGEYVIPEDTVKRLGKAFFDTLVASTDSNSTPAKMGVKKIKINVPEPPIRKSKPNMMTLPPITQSSMGNARIPTGSGRQVPGFSVVPGAGISVRQNNADLYGIVG
jgi:hypothetical protein